MAVSQNGWPVIPDYGDDALLPNPLVPGTDVRVLGGLARTAAPLLLEVARVYNATVEPLRQDWGIWGFDPDHAQYVSDSNHRSGTAADFNASRHPIGTSPAANFTSKQIIACRRIVARWPGVIRWGGDYSGRKDGMHWEIIGTPQQVAAAIAALKPTEDDTMAKLDADDLDNIEKIVKKQVTSILLNTPITGTKNYTIPVSLKALLKRAGEIK